MSSPCALEPCSKRDQKSGLRSQNETAPWMFSDIRKEKRLGFRTGNANGYLLALCSLDNDFWNSLCVYDFIIKSHCTLYVL